jgi:Uma2 family endonuclease
VPCVLFELASKDSWRADLHEKPALYAGIGIKEYFVFDPENLFVNPPLHSFRTGKGRPVSLNWTEGGLLSKELGLHLQTEGDALRLTDVKTGERLLTRLEFIEDCRRRIEE